VYAYDNEDIEPNNLLGKDDDRQVVLTRTLRKSIETINPRLPSSAYDDAIRQVAGLSTPQSLATTNRDSHALIKDGVQVAFRNDKGNVSGSACA